jgi:hypothetical protein
MRHAVVALPLILTVVLPSTALADPVRLLPSGDVEFDVRIVTSGVLGCHNLEYAPNWDCQPVSGGSVEIRNGAEMASIAFAGLDQTVAVTANTPRRFTMGEFVGEATPGFTFPELPSPQWAMLSLSLEIRQPGADRTEVGFVYWTFAPGGGDALPLLSGFFGTGVALAAPTDGYDYQMLAYDFSAIEQISLRANGRTPITADVNAIPEPGTFLLLGSGLLAFRRVCRRKASPVA